MTDRLRAYRYELRLRPAQAQTLARWAGGLRWVWNAALAEQQRRYAAGERHAGYAEMCRWLTGWRNAPATAWLALGPVPPQQQVLKRLDEAWRRFFAKTARRPRFCARGQEPGLRFPSTDHFSIDAQNQRLRALKLGWVRLRLSRPIKGAVRNLSLRRERHRWFASVQVAQPEVLPAAGLAPTLGLDLGVTVFAACSDGTTIAPLQALARQQRRMRRCQRAVSRKGKGSANRRKAVGRLARLHQRIARQRADWLHQCSTALANQHPVIAIEDLKVRVMTASARGTRERPGKRVKQKAGLNRAMLDASWREFARQLAYKLEDRGGALVRVPAPYTSQRCHTCGHVDARNRPTQARFACVACGHTAHADVNAACNILAAGHAVWAQHQAPAACGEDVRRAPAAAPPAPAASTKQEPSEATRTGSTPARAQ